MTRKQLDALCRRAHQVSRVVLMTPTKRTDEAGNTNSMLMATVVPDPRNAQCSINGCRKMVVVGAERCGNHIT